MPPKLIPWAWDYRSAPQTIRATDPLGAAASKANNHSQLQDRIWQEPLELKETELLYVELD